MACHVRANLEIANPRARNTFIVASSAPGSARGTVAIPVSVAPRGAPPAEPGATNILAGPKHVAAAAHGLQQGLIKVAINLSAESRDVHLDDVGHPFPVGIPEVLAQHLAGKHLPRVAHEELQQAELG